MPRGREHQTTASANPGLAVDLATPAMRQMIDRIGRKYGWMKLEAPSEWWHVNYRAGVWSGPDPGPYGTGATAPAIPELPKGVEAVALAVATMKDGRFELFVQDEKTGVVWHTWQAKEGGWAGAVAGKKNCSWYTLGKPGS